jgi:DNA-binding LacI/PurR family transcriptional regulator
MATITDVAKLAGVSTMTVSRVLNHNSNVSADKREAVLRAVASLNYYPNTVARTLVTNKSKTIGLLMTLMTNQIYAVYVESITAQLRKNGYDVLLYYADNLATALNGVAALFSRQVDGLILMPLEVPDNAKSDFVNFEKRLSRIVEEQQKPIVIIGNNDIHMPNHILEDYIAGAEMAVDYLVANGHRDIGYIYCSTDNYPWNDRNTGFMNAMDRNKLKKIDYWNVPVSEKLEEVTPKVMDFIADMKAKNLSFPTAFYCANDLLAMGAMHAFYQMGFSIPEDISFIGHDGSIYCNYSYPKLTSVDISAHETGEAGAKLMVRILKSEKLITSNRTYIPPKVIVRGSVKTL